MITIAALACPVGMIVMGWFMTKGMRNGGKPEALEVDDLRAEQRRLGAETERLEAGDQTELPAARR